MSLGSMRGNGERTESLFSWDLDWWNTAKVDLSRNLPAYVDGYRQAADLLVEAICEDHIRGKASVDCLVFPIGFLYRHHIELRLKQLIRMAKEFLYMPTVVPETHRIDQLWYELRPLLEKVDPASTRASASTVTKAIKALASVDPDSYAFRYPYGKRTEGSPESLPDVQHINVRQLRDKIAEIADLLEGCEMTISAHFEAEAEYRQENQKAYEDHLDECL